MQRLEVSGAVRPLYGSLGLKELSTIVVPHHPLLGMYLLRQASTIVHVMWKTYLSFSANNMIRYSHSAILLTFGANRC